MDEDFWPEGQDLKFQVLLSSNFAPNTPFLIGKTEPPGHRRLGPLLCHIYFTVVWILSTLCWDPIKVLDLRRPDLAAGTEPTCNSKGFWVSFQRITHQWWRVSKDWLEEKLDMLGSIVSLLASPTVHYNNFGLKKISKKTPKNETGIKLPARPPNNNSKGGGVERGPAMDGQSDGWHRRVISKAARRH